MKIEGNYWAFIAYNADHEKSMLCPGMILLTELDVSVDVSGLQRNFYDNALFQSKNEAIDAMIAQLESMKNG